jgi:hypothetical protein
MFSPTYILTTMSRIDVPLNLEIDYSVPSRLFQGSIIEIGMTNIVGGIKALSISLIMSFRVVFSFSISQTKIFKASPLA